MKQLAVRSLGWSIGVIALWPLSVLAAGHMPRTTAVLGLEQAVPRQTLSAPSVQSEQLLAVALGSRRLSLGDDGTDVRILQRYLSRNGIYSGEISGIYDQETADAVATYQRIRELPATGIADENTLIDMEFDFLPEATVTPVGRAIPRPTANRRLPRLLSSTIRPGSQSSDVIALQQRLNDFGFPVLVDGAYGDETEQAVLAYQRLRNLPVTGVADEDTLIDMAFDVTPEARIPVAQRGSFRSNRQPARLLSGNIRPGSRGSDVIALQQQLNSFGIPVTVDGAYGFETQQAVRAYQRVQGLNVTGDADAATLEAMGFEVPDYPYIAAVLADESQLAEVRDYFPNAYIDRQVQGRFINIGSFAERAPAEARVDAAAARGFRTRLLYQRDGLF